MESVVIVNVEAGQNASIREYYSDDETGEKTSEDGGPAGSGGSAEAPGDDEHGPLPDLIEIITPIAGGNSDLIRTWLNEYRLMVMRKEQPEVYTLWIQVLINGCRVLFYFVLITGWLV